MNRFPLRLGRRATHCFGLALLLLLTAVLAVPARAAQDEVQFGSTINVAKDSTIHDAVCFFCSVNVDGTVTGDIVSFFGSVHVQGQAKHDVVNFFGDVRVADDSSIGHDMVNFFGGVHLGEHASVGQDAVVMFGSLHEASTASIGGSQVVQPGWLLWIPVLLIVGIVSLVRSVRYPHGRYVRGY